MTQSTEFTVIKDELDQQEWPESTSEKQVLITGALADNIRSKTGASGAVVLFESGTEGGYSEFTVEWDYEAAVKVGDQVVFTTSGWSQFDLPPYGYQTGTLAALVRWVGAPAEVSR